MFSISQHVKLSRKQTIFSIVFGVVCFYSMIAGFSLYNVPRITALGMIIISLAVIIDKSLTSPEAKNCGIVFISTFVLIFFLSTIVGSFPPTALWAYVFFSGCWLMLKNKLKIQSFNVFISLYSILMLCSIIEYALIMSFGWGIVLGKVDRVLPLNEYHFIHYLFNLILEPIEVSRFQSLMHEPGDIGTLNGLLLFGLSNNRKYRNEFAVVLVSGLLSMSLAFYVLLAFYLLCNVSKFSFKYVFAVLLLGAIVYIPMRENIEQRIVYRVVENETIHRSGGDLGVAIEKKIERFDLLGEGLGATEKVFSGYAGVGKFIYDNGFLGLVILIVGLFLVYKKYARPFKLTYIFSLVAFCMSFVQRENIWEPQIVMAFILLPLLNRFDADSNEPIKKLA